jgi:ATP-dependent Clp protease ATP-binding subunit ClpC
LVLKGLSVGLSMAWQIAASEASTASHQYIGPEHMFIGICSLEKIVMLGPERTGLTKQASLALEAESDGVKNVFSSFELTPTELRRETRKRLGAGHYHGNESTIHRNEECKQVFNRAGALSGLSEQVSCLHFLAALMESPGEVLKGILSAKSVNPRQVYQQALSYQNKALAPKPNIGEDPAQVVADGQQTQPPPAESTTHYLDKYGRDLTEEARKGKLGPFIGRRLELLQLIQTLARKSKNNPVLVGEAGVGKTAIVEALAMRVVEGKDPQVLQGKRIVELSVGTLVAGTMYRGEFEQRLSKIIEEARSHPEIIIFIDEIHSLIGAGRAEGSTDAANIMKPALARGDLRCIGATTIAEYRRYIESDPALERRFEKVIVNEPSPEETLQILRGIRDKLQEYHDVEILDSAIDAAISLSIRFDADHQLPDKAIDLVDKAAARARVPGLSLDMDKDAKKSKDHEKKPSKPTVTQLSVATVLSDKIGVPVEIITGQLEGVAQNRLLNLKASLQKGLVGQDEAIDRVCNRLLLAHSGLEKRRGPLGVFMFLGPTGVGKTELAKLLAEYLFGNKSDMIRLDMSEYMEEHSVAKLIGSPPGYVGYESEGQLTGKLRTHPYSVVLLDEVEKAHPRVLDMFLQVFDDGRLTDAKGRTIDAKNAIFILTSNIRPDSFGEVPSIYDGRKQTEGVREKLRHFMRPEFLNRINEIIEFRQLNNEDVKKILRCQLSELFETVKQKQGVTVTAEPEAEDFLAKAGYSLDFGVRELQRIVEEQVQIPLSRLIINGDLRIHSQWKIVAVKNGVAIVSVDAKPKGAHDTEQS